ncbi:MAG: hypothetical protein JO334_04710 [Verrucomicrobia bacterium]|nr:hypothetical protein [Verrucomicrobiota bacterium]
MKRLIALAVMASQTATIFAGEPMVSSKQVVAPPPPPPVSFFRGNEFDIGAFATYVTGTNGGGTKQTTVDGTTFTLSSSGSPYGWGGGMDFTYWLPWKYAGFRFQGAGVDLSTQTLTVTGSNGFRRSGSASGAAAGVLTGDFLMRLPLDDFWPNVHLAPYIFGGGGGVFTGAGGNTINTPFAEVNRRFNNASSNVSNNRGLANIGGGAEYRFTPHIGVFGEAGYNWVGGGSHNVNSGVKDFIQVNFGLRYAF